MRFIPVAVADAFIVEFEPIEDERGFLARSFDVEVFAEHGIDVAWVQANVSFTRHAGTLRGLHWQAEVPEAKLVRCVRGEIFDVIADVRPGSPTFREHATLTLRAGEYRALYVPAFVAHGFLTRTDDVEVNYLHGGMYVPQHGRGVRWDDPAFGIAWPSSPRLISDRDRDAPDFDAPGAR